MLQVYSAQHPFEAYILKGVLESNGISCEVRGETLFGLRGELPMTMDTAPSIWIYDDLMYDEAKIVIAEYETSILQNESSGKTWTCNDCGEESEGQFTECWNCGKKE